MVVEKPKPVPSSSNTAPGNGRKDEGDLFKNLVEIVPLVESLMDRRANPSFKRRASMIYTAAPPTQSKVGDPKSKRTAQTLSAIKERDNGDNKANKNTEDEGSTVDNFSVVSEALTGEDVEKDMEELTALREQLNDLHIKISEKEEALKSAEKSMEEMATVSTTLHELKLKIAEKELLFTSVTSQLSNAEIRLAEKQQVLEKLECEARISNTKVAEIQRELDCMAFEKTALMLLFKELSKNDSVEYSEDNITRFQQLDELPHIDNLTEIEMQKMEEARIAYVAAVASAKGNPGDESIAAAAEARKKLEAYVF